METKFRKNISIDKLLNAEKCWVYSIYQFWVIMEKPTGGGR